MKNKGITYGGSNYCKTTKVIEAEIVFYKQQTATGIIEIEKD